MEPMPDAPAHIHITRTTVVHVSGALTAQSGEELRNILSDLIHGHGIRELIVDLAEATAVGDIVSSILEEAQQSLAALTGHLEVRVAKPSVLPELAELPEPIPTFVKQ